jgi:hypothetical protein
MKNKVPDKKLVRIQKFVLYLVCVLEVRIWQRGHSNRSEDRKIRITGVFRDKNGLWGDGAPVVAWDLVFLSTSHYACSSNCL